MTPFLIIIPVYILIFMLFGCSKWKEFLIFTGIVSIPLETTYCFFYQGPRNGWTSGMPISLSEVSFILLFFYLISSQRLSMSSMRIAKPIIFFIAACALSLINSTTMRYTIFQVLMISWLFFLYFIVFSNAIENDEDLYLILRAFSIALIFQGCYACAQYLTGQRLNYFTTGFGNENLMRIEGDFIRAQGTAPHPNGFATYLNSLLLMNIAAIVGIRNDKKLKIIGIGIGAVALLLTFSRGGWLGFAAAMALYSYKRLKSDRAKLKQVIIGIAVIGILIAFFPSVNGRILGDDHNSAMSRVPLMQLAYNMIQAHPIIGIGTNTFKEEIRNYISPDIRHAWLDQVHNMYLLVFAESGIIGITCFLWILITVYREAKSANAFGKTALLQCMGLGVQLSIISAAAHMFFDMYNTRLYFSMLFLQAGLVAILRHKNSISACCAIEDKNARANLSASIKKPLYMYLIGNRS